MTETTPASFADVLAFWREAGADRWYKKDAVFDGELRTRFLATWEAAAEGGLGHWNNSDEGTLALVIVLDQFPRNMFRNDPRAYSTDALARVTVRSALARGVDQRTEAALRAFLYLPLMHSEELADQRRCLVLFERLGDPNNLKYARDHAEIIRKFGRFPHRNGVLGRSTTKDEQAFLDSGGFSG